MEQLLGDVTFSLPEELLASETQANVRSMIREALDEGMSDEVLKTQQSEIETAAKERALTSLRSNFILQEIAAVEEIEVNDMDMIKRVGEMAEQAKKSVKVYLKELQKNDRLDQVRNSLLISKTIDFLVDSANVSAIEPEQADAHLS
jgi:trigger factor